MSKRSRLPGLLDQLQLALVARRFHVEGRSKTDIAVELGLSRFKVARMLDQARKTGLVKTSFQLSQPIDPALSDEVRSAYGLEHVLVLEQSLARKPKPFVRQHIGRLAAELLSEIVTEEDVLGLSWARSVNAMAESVTELANCPIVQLCGVHAGIDARDDSVETALRLSAVNGGRAYPIFAPLVLPDHRTAETLRRQRGIAETFTQFPMLTKAVVSIGSWQAGESTVYDVLPDAHREAVGDRVRAEVTASLFDADGEVVPTTFADNLLAITSRELLAIPHVVALGYSAPKAEAVDAVLRSGMVSTLITDAAAAVPLLALVSRRPTRARRTNPSFVISARPTRASPHTRGDETGG